MDAKQQLKEKRRQFANMCNKRDFDCWRSEQERLQNGRCYYCKKLLYTEQEIPYRYPAWYWDEGGPCHGLPKSFFDRDWSYHIDHVIPLAGGGTNDLDNLVLACIFCNTSKGAKLNWSFA
jgi:5-methylcytosine-specific restriction endonuclease McrA